MAAVPRTISLQGDGSILVTWGPFAANGDIGDYVELPEHPDKTVQFKGGWGTSLSISLMGSNDDTNYVPLTDPQGNAITKTGDAIEAVTENPKRISPQAGAGSGGTAFVTMLCRGRKR